MRTREVPLTAWNCSCFETYLSKLIQNTSIYVLYVYEGLGILINTIGNQHNPRGPCKLNPPPPLPHPQPIMGEEVVIHIVNYFSGPMKLGLSTSFVSLPDYIFAPT
jgi:hypothetical protein